MPRINEEKTTVEEMADGEAEAKVDQMQGNHDPDRDADQGVTYADE